MRQHTNLVEGRGELGVNRHRGVCTGAMMNFSVHSLLVDCNCSIAWLLRAGAFLGPLLLIHSAGPSIAWDE